MIRTNKGHIGDIETTNLIEFIWNDLKKTVEAIELRLSPKTRIRSFGNIIFQEIPTFERIGLLPIFSHDGRSVNCRDESPTGILKILTVIEIQLCFYSLVSMYRMLCRCWLRHNCRRYNYQTKRNTQNFSFHYSLNLITRQSNGDMLDPAMYYSAYILYFCTIIQYNSLYILRNNVFLYARPDFYI